jgi:hypothetical protein
MMLLLTLVPACVLHNCRWQIPSDAPDGQYRLVHYGDAKQLPWANPQPFQGSSSTFTVTRNSTRSMAAAGDVVDAVAAAEMHQSALCKFAESSLVPQGSAAAGNSSWPGVPPLLQLQQLHGTAVLQRLGCRVQR